MKIFEKRRWKRVPREEVTEIPHEFPFPRKRDFILEYKEWIHIEVDKYDTQADEEKGKRNYELFKKQGFNIVFVNRRAIPNYRIILEDDKEKKSIIELKSQIENDLQEAISHLLSDEVKKKGVNFKGGQEFALIKLAIDNKFVNGSDRLMSKSPQSFINLIKGLGFDQIAERSSIYKYYQTANTDVWPWRYAESYFNRNVDCDMTERDRRNLIVYEFADYMAHLRGPGEAMNKFMNNQ